MDLKLLIRPELWEAISKPYEYSNYRHAIVDSIHFLTRFIQNKSNVDGDGTALINKAFGGESPILKLNKHQTETEKNIQKGVFHILTGIYQGIRNPRSHGLVYDSKETADAIILFINYLVGLIDDAGPPFSIQNQIKKVLDPDFFESEYYVQLLVDEIPEDQRLDFLISLYRNKSVDNSGNVKFVVNHLLNCSFRFLIFEKL